MGLVCSKVGMRPVPPLPPTTSDAAAAPYRAAAAKAVAQHHPGGQRAHEGVAGTRLVHDRRAPESQSTQDESGASLSSWIPSAPQVTATFAAPRLRSFAAASFGVAQSKECGRFARKGRGDQEGPRRQVGEHGSRLLHRREPGPEVGIENEAAGQCGCFEDGGPRRGGNRAGDPAGDHRLRRGEDRGVNVLRGKG